MAKKPTNSGTKSKTKAKTTTQPKNDTPPNPPETSNVQPTVESPHPPQPQAAPAPQQPLPAADSAPIPIPPPKAPSISVSIKPDNNAKPPSINYAWSSPPPNTAVQQPVDDGQGTNQGWGQPGENDDMYWGDQQGHADYNDYRHHPPDDDWGGHDDHYDDGDTDDYTETGQHDNPDPHHTPMVPSQSGGVAGGWEQPSSNWDPQPHAPAAPVQSHLIEAGLRGGSTAGGNNTPAGLQSPRPSAGVGSEVGGSGYRSPWTIDGKPPDKIQTASAAARKTVAFAGVKPTPPPSNPGKPPPPAAPPPPPKISHASKQAGLPHGGGADWGYGPPQGGAGAWGAPAPTQTWDPASQPKSHAASSPLRTTTSPATQTNGWMQWGKVNATHFTKITARVPSAAHQPPPQPKPAAPPPPPPPPPPLPPQSVPSAGGRTPYQQQQALLAAYYGQQPHGQQRRSQTLSALMVPGMTGLPAGYQWGAQLQHAAAQQHQRAQPGIPNAPPPPPAHNPLPPQQQQHKGNAWPHLPPGQGYGQGYAYDPIYGHPAQQALSLSNTSSNTSSNISISTSTSISSNTSSNINPRRTRNMGMRGAHHRCNRWTAGEPGLKRPALIVGIPSRISRERLEY
ncbi:hypothetical protein NLI96_g5583 [Meripilus lineatus]|uniref:Uncharacterized protein n=1 Tax=Meripilus lineatus TaxID=2056292 RepID=A0AAD5V830_9APHY|nr:hypothetical protein NLI96_g5583 [Physisporinus lineatus]